MYCGWTKLRLTELHHVGRAIETALTVLCIHLPCQAHCCWRAG